MVIVQNRRPDRFFDAASQQRLAELMARWRGCREEGRDLAAAEHAELSSLIDAELQASGLRAATLAEELKL